MLYVAAALKGGDGKGGGGGRCRGSSHTFRPHTSRPSTVVYDNFTVARLAESVTKRRAYPRASGPASTFPDDDIFADSFAQGQAAKVKDMNAARITCPDCELISIALYRPMR